MAELLLTERDDDIAVLTFNDPDRRNAMSRAMGEALMGHRTAFVRTPKRGEQAERPKMSAQLKATLWQSSLEVVFGLYLATGMWVALQHGRWLALPLVSLFSGGFLILGVGSIYTSVKVMWLARRHPVMIEPVYPERI